MLSRGFPPAGAKKKPAEPPPGVQNRKRPLHRSAPDILRGKLILRQLRQHRRFSFYQQRTVEPVHLRVHALSVVQKTKILLSHLIIQPLAIVRRLLRLMEQNPINAPEQEDYAHCEKRVRPEVLQGWEEIQVQPEAEHQRRCQFR